ncbi:MAG: hypothetical protein MUF65_12490 [Rubritepida sp.]|jgi:uncharacterized protein YjiS (DUF1127 family)|nr:hypothetical protein [Rubritepida sp.]
MSDTMRIYAPGATAQAPRSGLSAMALLKRYGAWLRRINDARALREMDAARARDIGATPGWDQAPAGFAADPRPLWGIGLTPQPMDGTAPWSRR